MPDNLLVVLKELNIWSTGFRVLLSVLLGGIIGLERGRHGRAAGLRTHCLVCLGAALSVMVGLYASTELHFTNDPLRVGAQVVSGIGFLGVGTIMIRNHDQVTGLTTAAGLWATACIGLAVGLGFYAAALFAFLAVIITITILIYIETMTKSKTNLRCYIELSDVSQVNLLYAEIAALVYKADIVPAKSGISNHVGLELNASTRKNYELLLAILQANRDVVIALPC